MSGPKLDGWVAAYAGGAVASSNNGGSMGNVAVVGAQWGDEGKGKVVDWLSERADVVVRFQGGHNAGHTLVIDGKTYKLSLLPSGVVRGKLSIIGNGVVVDPWALLAEIERVADQGVIDHPRGAQTGRECRPDPAAARHDRPAPARRLAAAPRSARPGAGIGPAYEDKVGAARHPRLRPRRSGRAGNEDRAPAGASQCPAARARPARGRRRRSVRPALGDRTRRFCPSPTSSGCVSMSSRRTGKRILFEGAQGAMLDIDHGTYPFVTSSNTVSGQALPARASGPARSAMCWAFARPTRRGSASGPFPPNCPTTIGELHRRARPGIRHGDRAAAAMRLVRCGVVRQAVKVGGITVSR